MQPTTYSPEIRRSLFVHRTERRASAASRLVTAVLCALVVAAYMGGQLL